MNSTPITHASPPRSFRALAFAGTLLLPAAAVAQEAATETATTPAISGEQAKALESATEKLTQADAVLREHKISARLVDGTLKIEVPVTDEAERASNWHQFGLWGPNTAAQLSSARLGQHLNEAGGFGGEFTVRLFQEKEALARRCDELESDKATLAAQLGEARKHIAQLLDVLKLLKPKPEHSEASPAK